jgi:hypothetical protein
LDINITREEDKALEGCDFMAKRRLSSEEQIISITQYMKEKLENLKNLSDEEARKEASIVMVRTGLMDENGNFIIPNAGEGG